MSGVVRATASVTLPLEEPVTVTSTDSWAMPLVMDHVMWEHTYALDGHEALVARAFNSRTSRGHVDMMWYVIAGTPELIREVPPWVPAPPAGWDAFVRAAVAASAENSAGV